MIFFYFGAPRQPFIENHVIFYREGRYVDTASFLVITTSFNTMGILRALGLAVVIIVLRVLVPEIWNGLEHLVLSSLSLGSSLVDHLQAAVGSIPLSFVH